MEVLPTGLGIVFFLISVFYLGKTKIQIKKPKTCLGPI